MIQDFGEKIGGARKDYAAALRESFGSATDDDIASLPLSRVWKEPDYAKLLSQGTDPWVVHFLRATRDMVPVKPSGRRALYLMDNYVNLVKTLRDLCFGILESGRTGEDILSDGVLRDTKALKQLLPKMRLYELIGHGLSLKEVSCDLVKYVSRDGERGEYTEKWHLSGKIALGREKSCISITADTLENAAALLSAKIRSLSEKKSRGENEERKIKFIIYTYPRGKDGVFIGKKVGRNMVDLFVFKTAKEARDFHNEQYGRLVERLERFLSVPEERRDANSPRKGPDIRNGISVTPEIFQEKFHFRGVEFGNWVEQSMRPELLDQAYDSLSDLSSVCGISPDDLSMNSSLALSFGSRGRGGKNAPSAHFEPERFVINLTKRSGPGSLAHEWFHAMDHYLFLKSGGDAKDGKPFLSEHCDDPNLRNVEAARQFSRLFDIVRTKTDMGSRCGNLDRKRSSAYWELPEEIAARCFESCVRSMLDASGIGNDFLVNLKTREEYMKELALLRAGSDFEPEDLYPYLTEDETREVQPVMEFLVSTFARIVGAERNEGFSETSPGGR